MIIAAIVAVVVLGGIERIAKISSKIVPFMVGSYFLLVFYIIVTNITKVPGVFYDIVTQAFNFEAGFGAIVGIAIIVARHNLVFTRIIITIIVANNDNCDYSNKNKKASSNNCFLRLGMF